MKTILYENALFHTGVTEDESFRYMLVEGGRIKALRNERPDKSEYAKVVDLGGGHAFPCLIDAHVHLLYSIVLAAMGFDVCRIEGREVVPNTMAGIEARLREFAAMKKPKEIVVANGYILSAIAEGRLPSREELDDWCGGRAAVVYTIDGHASALSSAMLRRIGIDPEGHSGVLMGEAHERNQGKITDAISSAVTPSVLAKGIANIENSCAAWGISHVGALEGNGDSRKDLTTVLMLHLARHMDLKVRMYLQYLDVGRVERFRKCLSRPRLGGCGDWEMDGSIGAHSAAFTVPYGDTGEVAECYYSQEQVDEAVRRADELGDQIASHAIGDAANDRLIEALMKTKPGTVHRVEHGEFLSDEAFEKLKSGRFAVVMQPGYSWIDKRFLHSYEKFLAPEVTEKMRLASLYRAGVCVCGSSDSPVQSMDPYLQMTGMTDFYRSKESLTTYEAFRCYTIHPARALGEEENIGTLEVGKEANFFVAEENLFDLSSDRLSAFRPRATFYEGKAWREKKGTVGELLRMIGRRGHRV